MENQLYISGNESTIGQEKNYLRVPRSRRLDDKLILTNLLAAVFRPYRPHSPGTDISISRN